MTVLITADWQLCDNPRDAYRHEFQKQLRAIVKKHEVDCVLLLGDLTEEKDRHGAWLVNKIVEHLDKLRALCKVVIVRGNHDYVDISAPFYQFLEHIQGISWINEPTEAGQYCEGLPSLYDLSFTGLGKVLLLPHTTDYKRDWAKLKLKKYDWVFTHNTFQSAHVGRGVQMRGIPTNIFGSTKVISGDIHIPQNLGTVSYVGSPYLCDFGDNYEPRVMLVDKTTMRSVPVNGPQKRLIEVDSMAELKNGSAAMRYVNPGDILKVRMLITGKQKAEWPEIKGQIRAWGEKAGYQIHLVQPVVLDSLRGHSVDRSKQEKKSDEDLLRAYGKHYSIDKLTLKAGMILMRRV